MADHKLYLSYKCGEISLTDRTTEELQQIYNSSIILEKDGAYNFVINLYTLYNYRFTEKDFFHATYNKCYAIIKYMLKNHLFEPRNVSLPYNCLTIQNSIIDINVWNKCFKILKLITKYNVFGCDQYLHITVGLTNLDYLQKYIIGLINIRKKYAMKYMMQPGTYFTIIPLDLVKYIIDQI